MLFINDIYLLLIETYLIMSILTVMWLIVIYPVEVITIGKLWSIQIGICVISILSVLLLLYYNQYLLEYYVLGTAFIITKWSKFLLFLVISGILLVVLLGLGYVKVNSLKSAEVFLIFIIILVGFIILLFTNDFLSMYMGIELQSLGLYVLASIKQNSIYATEAGLKYFILGSVASCLLILGISIIYSFLGLSTFTDLILFYDSIENLTTFYISSLIGFLLVLISLLFKIGSVPFHIWLPDVYEGVATLITTFFSLIPKIVIFSLIIKLFFILNTLFSLELKYVLIISSLLSIIVGSIGALYQKTIKRLLSYSAIGHTGFILLGISLGNIEGLLSVFFYLIIYYMIILTVFGVLLQIQQKKNGDIIKYINNLGFIYKNNPILGSGLFLIFFTIAGLPPLSGFFSKFYILIGIIVENYFLLAVCVIICSSISCVYYLKVIRNIISVKDKKKNYLLMPVVSSSSYLIIWSLGFHILFFGIGGTLLYSCYELSLNFLY